MIIALVYLISNGCFCAFLHPSNHLLSIQSSSTTEKSKTQVLALIGPRVLNKQALVSYHHLSSHFSVKTKKGGPLKCVCVRRLKWKWETAEFLVTWVLFSFSLVEKGRQLTGVIFGREKEKSILRNIMKPRAWVRLRPLQIPTNVCNCTI